VLGGGFDSDGVFEFELFLALLAILLGLPLFMFLLALRVFPLLDDLSEIFFDFFVF
jgi:hypothetical protein